MPEAALQPFVTSQRPNGVASRAATQEPPTRWTWQATPNPTIEAGWTTTWPARPGYNAADEQNKLGNYYCWNRVYEPSTGRWTTPDPAASPWPNLWDYADGRPLAFCDPSGLSLVISTADLGKSTADEWRTRVLAWLGRICPGARLAVDSKTGAVTSQEPDFCGTTTKAMWGCTFTIEHWRRFAGTHPQGCKLIHCLLCSEREVAIKQGSPRFMPKDWNKATKRVRKKGDKDNKSDYENSEGSGGTVAMVNGWHDSNRKWNTTNRGNFKPSFPRLLAHELAHACRGVQGAMKLKNGMGKQGCWDRKDGYTNDEEYDVIRDWENVIAAEIASDPNTRANSDGKDIESGAERIDHGLAK